MPGMYVKMCNLFNALQNRDLECLLTWQSFGSWNTDDLFYFYSQGEGVRLLPREKSEVQNLLPDTITEEEKERIYGILGQAVCRPAGIQARKIWYSILGEIVF